MTNTASDVELMARYNYDAFTADNYEPWMRFDESPALGELAPDFPLWKLEDRSEVKLSEIWSSSVYTIVEFGSFT